MKYHVGDLVYYDFLMWPFTPEKQILKITEVTPSYYTGYNIKTKRIRSFLEKNSDSTLKLYKRGFVVTTKLRKYKVLVQRLCVCALFLFLIFGLRNQHHSNH